MRGEDIPFTLLLTPKGMCNVYKKNELKNLIYIQENKPCNEQTVTGLFRSIVEPVFDSKIESLVLCRLEENSKNKLNGILKRLEYSNSKVYDFSDSSIGEKFENILKDKIWDNTEFVYVLAERFGAALIFDYDEVDIESFAQIYLLFNSKVLTDVFEIINSNSKVDLKKWQEKFNPDRRDNDILNKSIRKIVENLEETNQENLISKMEKENIKDDSELLSRLEFIAKKSSYVAHEIRNQLSICNLYSTIIEKQSNNVSFLNEDAKKSITNARDCIRKSLQMTGNLLLDFKSMTGTELKEQSLEKLIKTGVDLAQIYANGKNIKFTTKIEQDVNVLVNEDKFLSVLINLIKNAVESVGKVGEEDEVIGDGEIVVKAKVKDEKVKIIVSNTGTPIDKELQEKIFEEGFTTKNMGSGLGLVICKKTLEEQFGQLKLKKSDKDSTEFEITVLKS